MASFRWTRRGAWTRNAANPDSAWSATAASRDELPPTPTGEVLEDWTPFSDSTLPGVDGWEAVARDGTRFVVFRA